MRATRKAILTDARTGLLGNGCAQDIGQIPDARNLHPPAGNPSNPKPLPWVELPRQQSDTSQSYVRGISCELVCSSHSTLQLMLLALWLIDAAFITS